MELFDLENFKTINTIIERVCSGKIWIRASVPEENNGIF